MLITSGCEQIVEEAAGEIAEEARSAATDSSDVVRGSGHVVSEDRAVSDFDHISVVGVGDVFITQGQEEALTIEAEDNLIPYIKTQVQGGTLTFSLTDEARHKNLRPTEPIKFHVRMREVAGLDISGAGDINAASLDTNRLTIVISGAGDVDITSLSAQEMLVVRLAGAGDVCVESLKTDESVVYLNGAGDVELAGRVVEQSIFLSGAGDYDAAEMGSQAATVEVSGVGEAIVRVSDSLDVRVSGPGSVKYYGDPNVSFDISDLGELTSLDDPSKKFPKTRPTEISGEEASRVIQGSGNVVSEDRAVSDFDRVSVVGIGDVFITQGQEEALTIEAEDNLIPYIKTQVQGGTLTFGLTDEARHKNLRPTEEIKFHVRMKEVAGLDISGAGDINAASLDTGKLEIVISGAGDVNIGSLTVREKSVVRLAGAGDVSVESLNAEESEVYLSGAGDVKLAGRVVEQGIFLSGAGDCDAPDLESQTATVELSGVGDVTLRASDTLNVRLSGPGSVRFYGNPSVSFDISGRGELISLDDPSLEFPSSTPTTEKRDVIRGSGHVVSEERAVNGFDRISLTGIGNVFIAQGEEEALTIEADDNLMPYIKSEVKDRTLVLGFTSEAENKNLEPSKPIEFHLRIKDVAGLELFGAGDINALPLDTDSLEILLYGAGDVNVVSLAAQEKLEVRLYGAGDVNIGSLSADESVTHIFGAGDVELAGRVVEQSVFINGAGDYRAAGLESRTTVAEVAGVGTVTVWTTDALDARVPGPGAVEYFGNPQITKDISRIGRLVRLGGFPKPPQTPASFLASPTSAYWPTSTPGEQGMNADLLAAMVDAIKENDHDVHSVTVIRNGTMVLDEYFHSFEPDSKHIIHSCTKSIVSALIGIAIDQGYIEGVEQPVLDLFPGRTAANLDAHKEVMTLEDLLTMSSGLECRDSYLYRWRGLNEMRASDDWVQFMLDLPMAEPPGTRFEYCNGGSFLLSAIIQETTGMSALEFAQEHLFGPLSITDVDWPANPAGINIGWGDMHLQPHDMAKIGYLYLNDGQWEGQQVVPAAWVEASTQAHITAATLSDGYGYQWWVDDGGYFMALGYAGQIIYVVPEKNLVVVFTSDLDESDFFVPETLLNEYIIQSVP